MLTITNPIALVPSAYDPDSREAELERRRDDAAERIEMEIYDEWKVHDLREALPPCRRLALDELVTEAAYAVYDQENTHV